MAYSPVLGRLVASLLLAVTTQAPAADAPRVALTTTAPSLREVTELAEVRLSEAGGARLVDRQQIDRVLAEQGLSQSGVVNADQAVSAGKLLAAELIAAVEQEVVPDAAGAGASTSLVVFDAATGVRLWDAATPARGEALAGDLVQGVTTALKKRGLVGAGGAGGAMRTVALQTVRNADLPREFDGVSRAAGTILMRRLASSPDLAVLERARLNRVTEERRLTGVEHPLLASTISIELQVARSAGGDGVDVTVALVARSGVRTTPAAALARGRRPDEIAETATALIVSALKAAPPRPVGEDERAAESGRYLRETMLRWRHGEIDEALAAAEAAHALNPSDRRAAAARARALLVAATALIFHDHQGLADPDARLQVYLKPPASPSEPSGRTPDKMDLSLQLAGRAAEALRALGTVAATEQQRQQWPRRPYWLPLEPIDAEPLVTATHDLIRNYLGTLRWSMFHDESRSSTSQIRITDEQAKAFAQIQRDFRLMRMEGERPAARALVKDQRTLETYGQFLTYLMYDARCIWPSDGREWTEDWATLVKDWVALARVHGVFLPPPGPPPWVRPVRPTTGLTSRPTTQQRLEMSRAARAAATSRFAAATAAAATQPDRWSTSVPKAMWDMTDHGMLPSWGGGYHDINWKMTEADWQRLVEAFDEVGALPSPPAQRVAAAMRTRAKGNGQLVSVDPVRRPTTQPADAPARPAPRARSLRQPRELRGEPVETAVAVGPGTSWPDSRVLLDLDPRARPAGRRDQDAVALPRVDAGGKHVYAVVLRDDSERRGPWRLELMRFNVSDGAGTVVSTYRAAAVPAGVARGMQAPFLARAAANGTSAALTGRYYVLCDRHTGVYLFPLDGGPVRRVDRATAELPDNYYQAADVLGDVLYLAVGRPNHGGYLLAYDLKEQTVRTVASSRRIAAGDVPDAPPTRRPSVASPFDNAAPMTVWHIQPDEARGRIVFLAMGAGWDKGLGGWWSYDPAAARFRQLLPIDLPIDATSSARPVWVGVLRSGGLAYSVPFTPTGSRPHVLDLATDTASPLPDVPRAAGYTGPASDSTRGGPALAPPLAEAGGWVWGRFGRLRIVEVDVNGKAVKKPELQSFEPLRTAAMQWGDWPSDIEPIDADRVAVADGRGLWLLRVPSDSPAAMANLVQPPRPVHAPVEPMGAPPAGGELPWSRVRTIYDLLRNVNAGDGKAVVMLGPKVVGNDVYVLACGDGAHNPSAVRLVKFSLADGKRTDLGAGSADGQAFAIPGNTRAQQAATGVPTGKTDIDEKFYYLGGEDASVYAFPLDGGRPKSMNLRAGTYTNATGIAAVGGKLFVSLAVRDGTAKDAEENTYKTMTKLIRVDMATGAREELALPAVPQDGPTPLPASPRLDVRLLTADPRRERVVFFANRQPTSHADVDGLWACKTTGAPERLDRLDVWGKVGARVGSNVFDWADVVRGNQWLVSTPNGALQIDLATLAVRRLWQVEPVGGGPLDGSYDLRPPMALVGGWLYDGLNRRAKLDGSAYQQLPALRPMDMKGYAFSLRFIEFSEQFDGLIVADNCGLWVLESLSRGHAGPPANLKR